MLGTLALCLLDLLRLIRGPFPLPQLMVVKQYPQEAIPGECLAAHAPILTPYLSFFLHIDQYALFQALFYLDYFSHIIFYAFIS